MPDVIKEATYSLLQNGKKMRMVDAIHLSSVCDMTNTYDSTARAFRSDCKRVVLVIIMHDKEHVF